MMFLRVRTEREAKDPIVSTICARTRSVCQRERERGTGGCAGVLSRLVAEGVVGLCAGVLSRLLVACCVLCGWRSS